jgi:hypothetical protein
MTFKHNDNIFTKFKFPKYFHNDNDYSISDVFNLNQSTTGQISICYNIPCTNEKCTHICNVGKIMVDKCKLNTRYMLLDKILGIYGFRDEINSVSILCLVKKFALLMLKELMDDESKVITIEFNMIIPTYDIRLQDTLANIYNVNSNMYHLSVMVGMLLFDKKLCNYVCEELSITFYNTNVCLPKSQRHIEYDSPIRTKRHRDDSPIRTKRHRDDSPIITKRHRDDSPIITKHHIYDNIRMRIEQYKKMNNCI